MTRITTKKMIPMVDLIGQYQEIKEEVDAAITDVCNRAYFIGGPEIRRFENNLANYLDVNHIIGCANGTDAIQIALMALNLKPGDEVIVPSFTFIATAEVIALLGLVPIMVDVDPATFNMRLDDIEDKKTERIKAIVPVHLFGQSCDMEPILKYAQEHDLYVIEDNAQAIGAEYTFSDGTVAKTGTMGDIGTTSFFPSKNLGCFGDGGAVFTNDDKWSKCIRMIANHGMQDRYYHKVIGVNSRLDSIQAAVLDIKLKQLEHYNHRRQSVADRYDIAFMVIDELSIPVRLNNSTHVYHQYTLKVANGKRDQLVRHLSEHNIASGIYYPVPLHKQEAFARYVNDGFTLPITENLCSEVISLPIHTELDQDVQDYIIEAVASFFR